MIGNHLDYKESAVSEQGFGCGVCGSKESPAVGRLAELLNTDPNDGRDIHPADFMGQSMADTVQRKHEEEILRLKIIVKERGEADAIKCKVNVLEGLLYDLQRELSLKEEFIAFVVKAPPKFIKQATECREVDAARAKKERQQAK